MFGLEPVHLAILALVILLVFGPKRLPELARGLGQGMRDFKKALHQEDEPRHDETPPHTPSA
jgi:sec-independent protein translocase protein TatA